MVSATMITVTGLVFSLTIVAIQIASSQFSPRLLRNFLRDRGTQLTLSTFVSTFAYSLAGLHTVGAQVEGGEVFVPRLAISGSLVLALASLAMLVYFLHHIAHAIQIDGIMEGVERETLAVIDATYPEPVGPEEDERGLPEIPLRAVTVPGRSSGYVQSIDPTPLVLVAAGSDAVVRIRVMVGEHVVAGTPLAWAWSRAEGGPAPDPAVLQAAQGAVRIGFERTMQQDVGFGLRRLVDIALRALSPAVNDPYTAVQSLQHLADLLCHLAGRRLTDELRPDQAGVVRVALPHPGFEAFLRLASDQIRRVGAREPAVARGLFRMLADAGGNVTTTARRRAVAAEIRLLLQDVERETAQEADLPAVRQAAAIALAAVEAGGAGPIHPAVSAGEAASATHPPA